jgi:hypothetical protein
MESEEIKITNDDYWFKIVDMLQQDWAIVEPGKENGACAVYFIDDNSGVFDQLQFDDAADAKRQLKVNGFERYADNSDAEKFIVPPSAPFHRSTHPNGPIYSSGRDWKTS